MNPNTIISVHGYAGDAHQIQAIMPALEHHNCPIIILSPEDSPIDHMGPHICAYGGKRAYIGQDSWDRQLEQMRRLLEYPWEFILMNDSDSFVLTPELPAYLYNNPDVVFSNETTDFRRPGETWIDGNGTVHGPWPTDYHAGYPLIAMQPPYFMSRNSMAKMVAVGPKRANDTTPFIDWFFVEYVTDSGLQHHPFETGASCETVTPNGIETMRNCIAKNGATFIHSVKTKEVFDDLRLIYKQTHA